MPIAQLYDYVALLTDFRNKLEEYCDRNEGTTPVVFVFTRQLPSDWPLWGNTPSANLVDEMPLEKYARKFQEFLERSRLKYGQSQDSLGGAVAEQKSGVLIRRVIVLDNVNSPAGRERQAQLVRDAGSGEPFDGYVNRLHTSKNDIWVWEYDRPWPGWLTDVAFYGVVKNPNRLPQWFWAVTSSYQVQEDLIVLQLHHSRGIRKCSHEWQPLPGNCESLNDLADGLAEGTHTGLRTLKVFLDEMAHEAPYSAGIALPTVSSAQPVGDPDNPAQWQWHLREAIKNADQLKAALAQLGPKYAAEAVLTPSVPWDLFPLKITPHVLHALKQGLAQDLPGTWEAFRATFIPSAEEAERLSETSNGRDGIGEERQDKNPVEAITNFYKNRVLFRVTKMCPVHCRYCFRRRMVTESGPSNEETIEEGLRYIASDNRIKEVILSGGDPLVLRDSYIDNRLLLRLMEIEHVRRVRIDTRVLTTLPQRVTEQLVSIFQKHQQRKRVYVVGHFTHVYELEPTAVEACRRLVDAGIPVLAHIPLLHGVNDDSNQLSALMEKLVDCRIRPYYLIQYIPTRWTQHFRVRLQRARKIVGDLHRACSGLAMPTFIVYLPDGKGKVPVIPNYLTRKGKEGWTFRTPEGPVLYPEPPC
jgi:lysine 2,3-aminomutase